MKHFVDDIEDYISGKIDKEAFKSTVEKGCNLSNNDNSYDLKQGLFSIAEIGDTVKTYTYEQKLKLLEGLDNIVYAPENKNAFDRAEPDLRGSLLFSDVYARSTKAAQLAAHAIWKLAAEHPAPVCDFYQGKTDEKSPYYGCGFEYAFSQECQFIDSNVKKMERKLLNASRHKMLEKGGR